MTELTADEIAVLRYLELQQRDTRAAIEDNEPSWIARQSLNKQGLIQWSHRWEITLAGERALEKLQGDAYNPVELLGLIEKAYRNDRYIACQDIVIDTIAYLSGDHEPLKKLAGVE